MQHEKTSTRQKLHSCGTELVSLMLGISEAEQKTPPEPPTARHQALAALALAARENIRAFLIVDEHMK